MSYVKNTILILALTLGARINIYGQYFNKTYKFGAGNDILSSLQVNEDTIFAISEIFDSTSITFTQLTRFDNKGQVTSKNIFGIPRKTATACSENTLIKTKDGGFAYAGWTISSDSAPPAATLIKYYQNGSVQFYREYTDSTCDQFYFSAIIQDVNSNYYLAGDLGRYDSNAHQYTNDNMFLIKTDSIGNKIFYIEINDPAYASTPWGLCTNNKGNVVLSGRGTNIRTIGSNYEYLKIVRKFYEFDKTGNIVNSKISSGADTLGPSANFLIHTSDGGYLLADGYLYEHTHRISYTKGSIAKVDSNFNVVWQIDTGAISDATIFKALVRSPDGNYIAAGRSWFEDPPNATHVNGRLMKFKEDGTILWDRLYRGVSSGNDDNNFRSVGFLSNGDIIAGGEALNLVTSDGTPQRSWLMRLDSMGCLRDSADCGVVVDGIENLTYTTGRIKLYPIPASDKLILEYLIDQPSTTHIQITNILGQIIFESHQSESHHSITIDVKDWPIGMYSYKLYSEKGFTSSASFIVSH